MVNGSTCGLLAAIHAVTDIGDSIIMGRNCHKAVYNAVMLRNLQANYFYPEYIEEYGINGGYNPQELEKLFSENDNIKAVVITSPTYDGIVSDVEKIAEITHRNNAVLIVDEAHGAHLGLSNKLPVVAYNTGADIVIESTHKTLPTLTQTALLHLCGDRVKADKIEEGLGIYETSSPSYLLMGSIDKCVRQLQTNGRKQAEELLTTVDNFRRIVNICKHIQVPGSELKCKNSVFDVDLTKLIISVQDNICSGKELAEILRLKYHFEMEMESLSYVLAITTISDDKEEIIRLAKALQEIDEIFEAKQVGLGKETLRQKDKDKNFEKTILTGRLNKNSLEEKFKVKLLKNKRELSVYEAKKKATEVIKIEDSKGRTSAEYLYLYPPGIPILVPEKLFQRNYYCRLRNLVIIS